MNDKRNLSTSKELHVEFSLPNATLFGGALPMLDYIKKQDLENQFSAALEMTKPLTLRTHYLKYVLLRS